MARSIPCSLYNTSLRPLCVSVSVVIIYSTYTCIPVFINSSVLLWHVLFWVSVWLYFKFGLDLKNGCYIKFCSLFKFFIFCLL